MNPRQGILLDPLKRTVQAVSAAEWDASAILDLLGSPVDGAVCFWDLPPGGDYIVVGDFLNGLPAGRSSRKEGFQLFGKSYFGRALILGREPEEALEPACSVRQVEQEVTFFDSGAAGAER